MKSSQFTEEQIIGILKQAEAGVKARDLCRQHGIPDHTYYRWEEENRQLKQLLTEKELDLLGLRTALSKKY
jgi:putative transposase